MPTAKELEDFRGLVRRLGLDPDHFEVSELSEPPSGFQLRRPQQVLVRHMPSGVRRIYRIDIGQAWLPMVSEDLKRGRFSR